MTVYLVWDGYEDVVAVFLSRENAQAFVDKEIERAKTERMAFSAENISISEMEVSDAP